MLWLTIRITAPHRWLTTGESPARAGQARGSMPPPPTANQTRTYCWNPRQEFSSGWFWGNALDLRCEIVAAVSRSFWCLFGGHHDPNLRTWLWATRSVGP